MALALCCRSRCLLAAASIGWWAAACWLRESTASVSMPMSFRGSLGARLSPEVGGSALSVYEDSSPASPGTSEGSREAHLRTLRDVPISNDDVTDMLHALTEAKMSILRSWLRPALLPNGGGRSRFLLKCITRSFTRSRRPTCSDLRSFRQLLHVGLFLISKPLSSRRLSVSGRRYLRQQRVRTLRLWAASGARESGIRPTVDLPRRPGN